MNSVVILGAGGLGRELADLVSMTRGLQALGFIDIVAVAEGAVAGTGLGLLPNVPPGTGVINGLGDGRRRERADRKYRTAPSPTIVHPHASLGRGSAGDGLVLLAGARVTTDCRFGRQVLVNQNATVGHDVSMGDYVLVHPGANVSGNVSIGARTVVGAGSVILQGLTIGADVVIGAGAVVTGDVPSGVTAIGLPARWG